MPVVEINGRFPKIPRSCFVADNASVIGKVTLGEECSVWFGAVMRCELEEIKIGRMSNVQDNCVLHTDLSFPVEIGEGVSIGHGAVVHGAKVGSNCIIGMRATLLNGAKVGENCIVAAASLVTEGKEMPSNSLIMGRPAIVKRKLEPDELFRIKLNAEHYNSFREEYLRKTRPARKAEPS